MAEDTPKNNLRDGRYAIVRLLGEGAQAATFEAVDKREGRPVAIKRFRVRGAKSWKEVELAEREAAVLSSLSHPGLPRYVEHFEEAGELFLVTERIEGESIAALRKRGVRLGEADVVRFLREAAAILDYLHTRAPPIVHRDIKPSNVIRKPDGSFVLIDFGAVRDRMKPEGGSTVVGTFGYMAPEQFQGRAMPVSDVYSVGATALAMLTGSEPEDLPHKGLGIDVDAALGKNTSPSLVTALSAMLLPDPDSRARRITPLLEGLGQAKTEAPRTTKQAFSKTKSDVEKDLEQSVKEAARHIEEGFARFEEEWKRNDNAGKYSRKAERKAEKAVRKAAQREARARRMEQSRERRSGSIPQPIAGIVLLALTLAQVALTLSLRVVVPVFLTVLSVIFGKSLREASSRAYAAGTTAYEAIERAKDTIRGRIDNEKNDGKRIDVKPIDEPSPSPKTRIAADDDADDNAEDEALAEEEAASDERRKQKRR